MKSVELDFHGPLAWFHADNAEFIFDAGISHNPGIYLWTVEIPEGHLVWYVGQTRSSFHKRMKEHFKETMSGSYEAYDPDLLAQGERKTIWKGYYGKNDFHRTKKLLEQPPSFWETLVRQAKITRFFVAPMHEEAKWYRRVEGGLGRYLREQPGLVGEYLSDALRYDRPWREGEDPWELRIKCPPEVLCMPERLVFDNRFELP